MCTLSSLSSLCVCVCEPKAKGGRGAKGGSRWCWLPCYEAGVHRLGGGLHRARAPRQRGRVALSMRRRTVARRAEGERTARCPAASIEEAKGWGERVPPPSHPFSKRCRRLLLCGVVPLTHAAPQAGPRGVGAVAMTRTVCCASRGQSPPEWGGGRQEGARCVRNVARIARLSNVPQAHVLSHWCVCVPPRTPVHAASPLQSHSAHAAPPRGQFQPTLPFTPTLCAEPKPTRVGEGRRRAARTSRAVIAPHTLMILFSNGESGAVRRVAHRRAPPYVHQPASGNQKQGRGVTQRRRREEGGKTTC